MNRLVKALSPLIITGAAITCAHAEATPVQQQLDVALYKDGHQIAMGTSIIKDEIVGKAPYAMRSGTEIGYGRCTKVGNTKVGNATSLASDSVFVGLAMFIDPVVVDGTRAQLSVSVQDTEFVGKHEDGPADCGSETVSTKGLKVNKVIVDIADGQSIDVPLGDTHYRLALKLHNADL
ncbi:hypothetical protein [Paraburkholderia sp. 22B1P]|uniref:hypothetical protein n=1 Tax=Paraburkholderia sp. 22B1P TaxID=3080498 RepID=UPI00308E0BB0|nr:hypothetical protein PBP221_81630 [Paraburkholderia sp. 22B1P]